MIKTDTRNVEIGKKFRITAPPSGRFGLKNIINNFFYNKDLTSQVWLNSVQ